jgi:predicted lipid carrier protein YhbT
MNSSDVENPFLLCASTNSRTFDAPTLNPHRTVRFAMKILSALEFPIIVTPLPMIQIAVRAMLARILATHPNLFERLGEHGGARFCFSPTDVPLRFLVEPAARLVTVLRRHSPYNADATIEASLGDLLGLLSGKSDGDALFFSRAIAITGDMEAVLALRNALDDAEIDLVNDVVGKESPLRPFAQALLMHLMPSKGKHAWN